MRRKILIKSSSFQWKLTKNGRGACQGVMYKQNIKKEGFPQRYSKYFLPCAHLVFCKKEIKKISQGFGGCGGRTQSLKAPRHFPLKVNELKAETPTNGSNRLRLNVFHLKSYYKAIAFLLFLMSWRGLSQTKYQLWQQMCQSFATLLSSWLKLSFSLFLLMLTLIIKSSKTKHKLKKTLEVCCLCKAPVED